MPRPRTHAVGVDLGGTKIAAGVFGGSGSLRGELVREPTLAHGPAEHTISRLEAAIRGAISRSGVALESLAGIGIGTTGPLDPSRGILLDPETLPHLWDFPLARAVEERFALPVALTNDANAFALGEAIFGVGRGASIVLGVTLGTGCGVGIVIGGKILEGASANAGEMYRVPIEGGTFDSVLSGPGLASILSSQGGESASPEEIAARAAAGDEAALAALDEFGRRLGRGLGILAAVIDPAVIVLGGSVTRSAAWFLASALRELPRSIAPSAARTIRVELSRLGELAAAAGAAALILGGGRLDGEHATL